MKSLIIHGILFVVALTCANAAIITKSIYGIDDRMDIYESSDSLMRELSRSVASQILASYYTEKDGSYTLKAKTLAESEGICPSERFANQLSAASCTGFLISPDTLVTAGHCVSTPGECQHRLWFFDFASTTMEKKSFTFTRNQVFRCTKIIAHEYNESNMNDFAVIKLDRPVAGRSGLKFRTSGKVSDDATFTVIGNPSGLPLKITSGAKMRNNQNAIFFDTNSDTYGGNSGSPVIDSKTGIVEGILVRGDQDYTRSKTENCSISIRRDELGGRGESATRMTNIKFLPIE